MNDAPLPPMSLMAEPSLSELLEQVGGLIRAARSTAVAAVSSLQVGMAFEIGRRIVEQEQQGAARAEYGTALLKLLSESLTAEFGRGFSRSNLEYMRRFYLEFGDRGTISQTASGKSAFRLSWSQYVFLLSVTDRKERSFYEREAADSGWTLPELKRQFDSGLYERLALSGCPERAGELAEAGATVSRVTDIVKDPYVLEFLGIAESPSFSEGELETAIIGKLEQFLLELGKGFLFEARQRRFTFDADHFFVDLVFYNRLLRCYVLIDLKIGKLAHQDLGQMQMYVNYFDRFVRLADENPTVGIVLCKTKNDALVELTLPQDSNVFASRYQLYLPSKEELKQRLMDWTDQSNTFVETGEEQ